MARVPRTTTCVEASALKLAIAAARAGDFSPAISAIATMTCKSCVSPPFDRMRRQLTGVFHQNMCVPRGALIFDTTCGGVERSRGIKTAASSRHRAADTNR